jgi:hypothetical protein
MTGWTSPRKNRELAKALGEHMARAYEKHYGRPLTADELAGVHAEALESALSAGRRQRRQAAQDARKRGAR